MQSFEFPLVLAAETVAKSSDFSLERLLIMLAVFIGPIVAGYMFANSLRLPDYGWKLALILWTIVVSTSVIVSGWPPALGVDLKGGVILVYEIDEEKTLAARGGNASEKVNMAGLAQSIKERLNPAGLKEIVVRPYGSKQIEVIIPDVDEKAVERIKELIYRQGEMKFMILVDNPTKDANIIQAARDQAEDLVKARSSYVYNEKNEPIGLWAALDRDLRKEIQKDVYPFKVHPTQSNLVRNPTTGEILDWTKVPLNGLEIWAQENKLTDLEVLLRVDKDYQVVGDDLAYARRGVDENLSPCIEFGMKGEGIGRMSELTGNNVPEHGVPRMLSIVFDGRLVSSATIQSRISDQGRITGNFSQIEVDNYVELLRKGSLKAVIKKTPISENQIGSLLGKDTIEKGSYSLLASVIVVLGFILIYYQFAGFVACAALVLNVALTVAIMMLVKAPFTMSGLAGLVLTVGMSVDANVLIYERMREEFAKGSGFRLALRNGFDRAMVTIIDSNLTTLLTGLVLYVIGTDQVRGFAITLVLGILTSMYTAIFFARVVFEITERTGLIKSLSFFEIFHKPNVDWVNKFKPAVVASVIFIGLGLAATVMRGRTLFDIDLAGGTEVTMLLDKPTDEVELRKLVGKAFHGQKDSRGSDVGWSLHEVAVRDAAKNTVYRLDSSLDDVDQLKALIDGGLGSGKGLNLLKKYKLEVGTVSARALAKPGQEAGPDPDNAEPGKTEPGTSGKSSSESVETKKAPAENSSAEEKTTQPEPEKEKGKEPEGSAAPEKSSRANPQTQLQFVALVQDEKKSDEPAETKPESKPETPAERADEPKAAPAAAEKPAPEQPAEEAANTDSTSRPLANVITSVQLSFPGGRISREEVEQRFRDAAQKLFSDNPPVRAFHADGDAPGDEWTLEAQMDEARARQVVEAMKVTLESSPIWQSSSKIGGQVATDMQLKAVFAVLLSLIGIAIYVWFRFHKLSWGIAAITSLAHDTLVMLGCIAMSYWIADALKPLLVEEFKISLTVIAAFLTLIGYSINDTIVIFDRIREVRGKDPALTVAMINDSLNQTLSRTILTSGTVFATVVILYIWGGPGIHTFAFSMLVGVISGTYSTVFIAAPMLLWMMGSKDGKGKALSV